MRRLRVGPGLTCCLGAALMLAAPSFAAAQECDRLQKATASALVSFLQDSIADESNAECFTFAMYRLGQDRYEPSVPVLVRLLDFRRPATEREKRGYYIHMQSIYPAVEALEEIGKNALPAVLEVIKSDSSSATARDNAVSVWMEIYKYESPKGVALLRQEAENATDNASKKTLNWAVSKALTWCNPPDEEKCKAAASVAH